MIGKERGQKVHLQVHAKSCVPHIMARKEKKSGSWFKVDQCTVLMKNIISYQCIFGEEIKKKIVGRQRKRDWDWHSCLRNASGGNSWNLTRDRRKAERGRKQRCRESSGAIQIRKACTAVKHSCAGSHSELNWRIIRGKALFPGSAGTLALRDSGVTCSKWWRTWQKYQKLYFSRAAEMCLSPF